jgi:tetratricopeptide (TPR) repeat protein
MLVYLIVLKISKQANVFERNIQGAAVFGALFLLAGHTFIEQSTIAEVFMLNLVIVLLIMIGLINSKYSFAGFIFGLGMGNQHTLILCLPMVVFFLFFNEKERVRKLLNFTICMIAGLSVYLYLPIRAVVSPPLNWGNPVNIINFIRVITRQDYGTFSLHSSSGAFSIVRAVNLIYFFFKYLISSITIPGFIIFVTGMYQIIKKSRVFGISLLLYFIITGPAFFAITNMKIDAAGESILARFFLLPYAAVAIGSAGIILFKNRFRYLAFVIPLYLLISNYSYGSSKEPVLYNYIQDVTDTLASGEPIYVMKGGVGDDIIFGLAYLKWAEGKLENLKVYSQYGSIFEKPIPVKSRAAFATFASEATGYKLYQAGLLYKNYSQKISFDSYRGVASVNGLNYRQRNVAANYPFFAARQKYMQGKVKEGEKEIENALKVGGDIPWLLNNIGNIYRDTGIDSKAFEYYEKAINLQPTLGEGYNNIANIYFKKRLWDMAVSYYKKAIDIEPDAVRYYNLGLTYLTLKEYDKAQNCFHNTLSENPYYINAYNDLGLI